jgi:MFS family permease
VPLAIAATVGTFSLPLLLLVASLYWAAGLSTGPAWNSWMERLVPAETRARFFSRRSRLQLTCTFCSLLGAGLLLQYASQLDRSLSGFAVLFCFAAAFRLLSAGFLHRQHDGHYSLDPISKKRPATCELATEQQVPGAAKRLLMYLVLMQGCVQLSGPFFVPYMLKQLEFGYGQYVFLISLSFVSKVISVAFWGRFAERSGATKLLWLGGFGLVPLASLWILSTNFWWLAVIQILSGIAWAAYELGFFLSFFETLPTGQRTKLLTIYNLANTLAICVGALTGWAVLSYFGCHSSTYYCLFAASSFGRLLCLSVLIGFVSPKRKIRSMVLRILSVRPGAGSIGAPVVASQTDS